jgi:hypothetical protein
MLLLSALLLGAATPAEAVPAEPTPAVVSAPPPPVAAPAPAPYSVPFQLRGTSPARAVRLDNALDFYGNNSVVNVLLFNASWSFHPRMYVLGRLGVTFNAPSDAAGATSLSNLLLGGAYVQPFGDFRFAAFLGVTLPTATGGGNDSPGFMRAANSAAMPARNAMDNALFAANDMAVIPGLDLAWVKYGATVQLELNLTQVFRVRGEAVQSDVMKTNLTSGLHLGYFVLPQLSLGAELRYQRWLSNPAAVVANEALRQNLNAGVGARLHLKLSPSLVIRPGLSYSHGLISASAHNVVQVDVLLNLL